MNLETLKICLGNVAPLYNLVLAVIIILLFIRLLRMKDKKQLNRPWKLLFIAILIYSIEEVFTVLRKTIFPIIPRFINGFFEMAMISLFIYMMLKEKHIISLENDSKKKGAKK